MDIAELGLSIRSDGVVVASNRLDKLTNTSKRAGTATDKMVAKFQSLNRTLGLVAIAGGAAMTAFAASSLKAAIAAEEVANKFQVVFRGSVEKTNQQLIALTKTIPMTVTEMRGLASGIQDMLVPMGLAREQAAGLSVEAVKLAGDIASFNNVKAGDVLRDFQSALAGQIEPLRKFGVFLTQDRIKTIAYAEGIATMGEELTAAQKAQATFIAITQDSSDALGDAARTVNSTANQLKFMRADIQQAKEDLGKGLIPAFRGFLTVINEAGDDGLTPLQAVLKNTSLFILNMTKTALQAIGGLKLFLDEIKKINDVMSVKLTAPDWLKMIGAASGGNWGAATEIINQRADAQAGEAGALAKRAQERAAELAEELANINTLIEGFDAAIVGMTSGLSNGLEEAKVQAKRLNGELKKTYGHLINFGKIENPFDTLTFNQTVKSMEAEIRALEGGAEAWREYERSQAQAAAVADIGITLTETQEEVIRELAGTMYDLKNPIDEVASSWQRVGSVLEGVGGAASEALRFMAEGVEKGTKEYRQLEVAMAAANVVAALGAVLNQGNGDPYTAWARMATMAAALGVAIGGLDGGFTDTAADRQESQGTGSVLGDAQAKSESILKSTEITADATSKLVGINRGMLNALERLNAAITGATASISSGGMDANFSALPSTIDFASIHDIFGGNTLMGKVWQALLGGKSKITDQGVAILAGNIQDMIDGDLIKAYQEVQYKKWRFGSTKTREEMLELQGDAANQIGLIFEALADAVTEGALALGISMEDIQDRLSRFRIEEQRISLLDLSADEQAAQLQAVFSKIFDGLALAVVPFIGQFQQVGEGLGETLVRVATSVQVMQEAIGQLGWAVDEMGPEAFAQMSVSLIELTGGISEFISKFSGFVSKFATDEYKFNIATDALTRGFASVGLELPDTAEGLWDLMQSLDAGTEQGQRQIAMILELTDYADTYYAMMDELERERLAAIADADAEAAAAAQAEADRIAELQYLREEALSAEVAALMHIQGIAEGLVEMFASLRDMIISDLSTPDQNYARAKSEAERLAVALQSMTDPDQIDATVRQIEELTRTAYGLLDGDQKQAMGQQFLTFIDEVQKLALDRLGVSADEALANTQLTPEEVLMAFNEQVTQPLILVAGLQESAAVAIIDAANYLMGQTPASFNIAPSSFVGPVQPVAQNNSADIEAAIRAGMREGAQAMADAAASIVASGLSSDRTTTASAEQISNAIRSLPLRIVVQPSRSEFA